MGPTENCQPRVRPLHVWEIQEAYLVFADRLNYNRVRIHECASWPDAIDRVGRKLKGQPPIENSHNAITLGNHCFFPVMMPEHPVKWGEADFYKVAWLIHELTHAWQFQKIGWKYLIKALSAQFKQGYDFGGENGLKMRRKDGWNFRKFNLEQQGDICRGYYENLCAGKDVSAWQDYIHEIQHAI
jgi:hypothetical protein